MRRWILWSVLVGAFLLLMGYQMTFKQLPEGFLGSVGLMVVCLPGDRVSVPAIRTILSRYFS